MFCMRCGTQFDERVGVCPKCGTVVGTNITNPPKKKRGAMIGIISGISALLIVAGIVAFLLYRQQKNTSELMAKCQVIYNELDNRFANYIVEDENKAELLTYKKNLGLAIQDRDGEKCNLM